MHCSTVNRASAGLLVLNGPETGLHPDLLPPTRLIANAAERTQVLVVSYAAKAIAGFKEQDDCDSVTLEKDLGETRISGRDKLDLLVRHRASR
ncbi:MAG TPA: hypothetical protein VJU84_15205 [Pyrinomonadaceae bacterium]|nr:hypothetical protein [Pyrinomonadaceae bacterium]